MGVRPSRMSVILLLVIGLTCATSMSVEGSANPSANATVECVNGTDGDYNVSEESDGSQMATQKPKCGQTESTYQEPILLFEKNISDYAVRINETALQLPECVNVTLSTTQDAPLNDSHCRVLYWIEFNGSQSLMPQGGTTVSGCFPFSETFSSCPDKWKIPKEEYQLSADNLTLTLITENLVYDLGDFFIADDEEAIVCYQHGMNKSPKRRCNNMDLNSEEYERFPNGSLLLKGYNHALPSACYNHEGNHTDHLKVCIPLTQPFRDCRKWGIRSFEYTILPDKRLYSKVHYRYYEVGEYFVLDDKMAAVCVPEQQPDSPFNNYTPHGVFYSISAFCLLIAFIIHLIVPTLNYHAKPLLCHMFSLMLLYIALCIQRFGNSRSIEPCYTTFILVQFFGLASFFWLNVVAFELWKVFSDLSDRLSMNCFNGELGCCQNKNAGFYAYCVYAWGLPVLLTSMALILDASPELQEALDLQLHIKVSCWYNGGQGGYKTPLIFFYGPLAIIIIENSIFFFLTIWNLGKVSKETNIVNKNLHRQLFKVCLKLFLVMGLCWTIEVVSWATGADPNVWYYPDLINSVQGIIIFIIYICKPTTWKLLRSKQIKSPFGQWTSEFRLSKLTTSVKQLSTNNTRGPL